MGIKKFTRGNACRAGGVYVCGCCGKRTRETGHDESSVDLCAYCYREACTENEFNDGHIGQDEYEKRIAALKKEYGRK